MGLVYADLGQAENAQKCYRESFIIRKEIGDRKGEGLVLYKLRKMYFKRQQYDSALSGFLLARKIFKNIWSSEYEATQRWIETLQKTIGEDEFIDLLTNAVEAKTSHILEKVLHAKTALD